MVTIQADVAKGVKDKQFLSCVKDMIKVRTKLPQFKLKLLLVTRDVDFIKVKMKEYELLDPQVQMIRIFHFTQHKEKEKSCVANRTTKELIISIKLASKG